jgi:hypothetical protein
MEIVVGWTAAFDLLFFGLCGMTSLSYSWEFLSLSLSLLQYNSPCFEPGDLTSCSTSSVPLLLGLLKALEHALHNLVLVLSALALALLLRPCV